MTRRKMRFKEVVDRWMIVNSLAQFILYVRMATIVMKSKDVSPKDICLNQICISFTDFYIPEDINRVDWIVY